MQRQEVTAVAPKILTELGEGPLWCPRDQVLYWVDCTAKTLYRLNPATRAVEAWRLSAYPGAVALREQGGLLIALRTGLAFFDLSTGKETHLPTGPIDFSKERFNDGKVDRRGRLWVGTIDRQMRNPEGSLYRIDADLSITRIDSGVTASNGIAWSPDHRTMYNCDSLPGLVYAYDFDIDSGTVSNKRVLIDMAKGPGRPDGCTVDAQGMIWIAEPDAWRIGCYDPRGNLLRFIDLPVQRPSSVIFGGSHLDTLYIATMRFGLLAEERAKQPLAGTLLSIIPGVCGLAEPRFKG